MVCRWSNACVFPALDGLPYCRAHGRMVEFMEMQDRGVTEEHPGRFVEDLETEWSRFGIGDSIPTTYFKSNLHTSHTSTKSKRNKKRVQEITP